MLHFQAQSTDSDDLSELKARLKSISAKLAAASGPQLPTTTPYLISCDEFTGLQWEKMTQEQILLLFCGLQTKEIETLTSEVLKKVVHSLLP